MLNWQSNRQGLQTLGENDFSFNNAPSPLSHNCTKSQAHKV